MIAIGITGGVGMGKSTVAGIFARWGVPCVDTDAIARDVVQPGQPALDELRATFGPEVVGPDGQLRRSVLAQRVFACEADRLRLEAITHPRIRTAWRAQLEAWRLGGHAACVVAIPLLFEVKAEADLDVTICVACSAATQAQRVRERGWSAAHLAERIAAQWPAEQKMALAQFVIWNETGPESLEQQVQRIWHAVRSVERTRA